MVSRLLFLAWVSMLSNSMFAQPFNCTGDFILAISTDGDSTNLFNVIVSGDQGGTISFDEFTNISAPYLNAVGYRWTDNYLYGIAINTRDLYRIDASGTATFLHHFDEFDATKSYNAGDISIDGRYLVVMSGVATNLPWRNEELILIDLEDPDYNTTIIPLSTITGELVYALDIAFDPITGTLYGFDGLHGRLIKIIVSNAEVDNETYPLAGDIDLMAALFFDSFGNLYGYAKHMGQPGIKALYKIDIETGQIEFLLEGPLASGSDGCSCPYRLELLKSVASKNVVACTEVYFTYTISNASFYTQNGVQFEDQFPPGFEILEVEGNTYGGQVSGISTETLSIENMSVSSGVDSFRVKVAIQNVAPGLYGTQARLNELSESLGGFEVSDDPNSIAFDDPTYLTIEPLNVNALEELYYELCPGDTLILDATIPDAIFTYTWNDGSNEAIREITSPGDYVVTIENNCESIIANFTVAALSNDINLNLGEDQVLTLGDVLTLNPNVSNLGNLLFNWSETPGNTITCFDCKSQDLIPLENSSYSLTVTDENGCTSQDLINIEVEKAYQIYAANIFSPNGDGQNDLFLLNGKEGSTVLSFQIFNRWGDLNHKAVDVPINDFAMAWDGTFKGKQAASGVYVWSALIRFIDGEEQLFSGDVMVKY